MVALLRNLVRYFNLFPCPVCRTGYGFGNNSLCPDCLQTLPLLDVKGAFCPRCGGIIDTAMAVCSNCIDYPLAKWNEAITLMWYCKEARDLIHNFKFRNFPELARPLGKLGAEFCRKRQIVCDLIIPVPLHWRREFARTYNQAALLSLCLGKELNCPVSTELVRTRYGGPQSLSHRKERIRNLKNSFAVTALGKQLFKGKRILLVDDVFTTGSTLTAAAESLLKAEVANICVFTCARTRKY